MIFFIQSRYQLLLLLFISFFLCLFFPSVFHFVLVLILVFVISFFVALLSGGYEDQRIHNTVEYNSKKKEKKSEISVDFRTITQAARLLPSLGPLGSPLVCWPAHMTCGPLFMTPGAYMNSASPSAGCAIELGPPAFTAGGRAGSQRHIKRCWVYTLLL